MNKLISALALGGLLIGTGVGSFAQDAKPSVKKPVTVTDTRKVASDTALTSGKVAYLRVRESESDGNKLHFGDTVILGAKTDSSWTVAKGDKTLNIPACELTRSKAEIAYLRANHLIPTQIMCMSWKDDMLMATNQMIGLQMGGALSGGTMHSEIPSGHAIVLSESVTANAEARKEVRSGLPLYDKLHRQLPLVANALYCCTGASKTSLVFKLVRPHPGVRE